jgi:hypothetical protein
VKHVLRLAEPGALMDSPERQLAHEKAFPNLPGERQDDRLPDQRAGRVDLEQPRRGQPLPPAELDAGPVERERLELGAERSDSARMRHGH